MTTTNPSAPYFDKVAGQWDSLRTGYFLFNSSQARLRSIELAQDPDSPRHQRIPRKPSQPREQRLLLG